MRASTRWMRGLLPVCLIVAACGGVRTNVGPSGSGGASGSNQGTGATGGQGSACSPIPCTPTLIGSGVSQSQSNLLAYGPDAFYWVAGGSSPVVMRLGLKEGATPVVLAMSPHYGAGIAADAATVYWAATQHDTSTGTYSTTLYSVPISGGPFTILGSSSNTDVTTLVADDQSLYWGSSVVVESQLHRQIQRMPKTGGTPEIIVNNLDQAPSNLAVDATTLYWLEGTSDTQVMEKLKGSAAPPSLAFSHRHISNLTVVDGRFYFTSDVDSQDRSMSSHWLFEVAAGKAPVTMSFRDVGAVAVADSRIYFAADTAVMTTPVDPPASPEPGSAPMATMLATGLNSPRAMHVIDQNLYFVAGDTLFRLPR